MVHFAPGSLEKALADIKRTKLEAYFSLNASLPRERRLRSPDVPLHCTWNGKERRWGSCRTRRSSHAWCR